MVLAALGSINCKATLNLIPASAWRRRPIRARTLAAWKPLGPLVRSNSTVSPSFRLRYPFSWIAEKCTNTSSPVDRLDESVPFGSVKPLDCTFLSHNLLLSTDRTWNHPCFADVPNTTLRNAAASEDVSTLPGNKGCGSVRSFSAMEKAPMNRALADELRPRQSRSLEPVQCVKFDC